MRIGFSALVALVAACVRIAETLSSTGPAAGAGYAGYCDSGEVSWTADRTG